MLGFRRGSAYASHVMTGPAKTQPADTSPAELRRAQIAQAAADVFIRYGYARTTMGDIAAAAGVARPTLYLSFPHKRDIFGAVIEFLAGRLMAAFQTDLAGLPDLRAKLRHVCLTWGLAGYDLVRANPDAEDLFDLNFPPVRASHVSFGELLAGLLAEAGHADPEPTGQMMAAALKGMKIVAEDRDELQAMIGRLCDMTVAAMSAGGGS